MLKTPSAAASNRYNSESAASLILVHLARASSSTIRENFTLLNVRNKRNDKLITRHERDHIKTTNSTDRFKHLTIMKRISKNPLSNQFLTKFIITSPMHNQSPEKSLTALYGAKLKTRDTQQKMLLSAKSSYSRLLCFHNQ
jgi:hypothetical protein